MADDGVGLLQDRRGRALPLRPGDLEGEVVDGDLGVLDQAPALHLDLVGEAQVDVRADAEDLDELDDVLLGEELQRVAPEEPAVADTAVRADRGRRRRHGS